MALVPDFPLLPVGIVVLPSELIPLQVSEERFKKLITHCLEYGSEFGIVWLAEDGLRPIGCACEIAQIVERFDDGRINLIVRGTRPFQITARQDQLPYPAATVEFLADRHDETVAKAVREAALHAYAELIEQATDRKPTITELENVKAYEMAATVDLGLHAKQGLLDLRSESARLKLVTRLLRAALKQLDFADRAQTRARSNGKVHFAG